MNVAKLIDSYQEYSQPKKKKGKAFRKYEEIEFENVLKMLKLLLKKRVVLKYSSDEYDLEDILENCWFSQNSLGDLLITDKASQPSPSIRCGISPSENSKETSKRSKQEFDAIDPEMSMESVSIRSEENKSKIKNNAKYWKIGPKYTPSTVNKSKTERMNTLRINKIRHLLSTKDEVENVKWLNMHIFNLSYKADSKYLQEKDVIEIAMVICMFESKKVYELCKAIFVDEQLELETFESKYPLGLYKLLIFYEEMEVLEKLLAEETQKQEKAKIVSGCFSYTLLVNNPILAAYIKNEYISMMIGEILQNTQNLKTKNCPEYSDTCTQIIDSVLHYVNEFSELNGNNKYHKRIK